MPSIQYVYAREILDARGLPTVECQLWLDSGIKVTASVPSGTSKGKYEAKELRDSDPNHMVGQGVLNAVNNVNQVIAPAIVGQDPANQENIDQILINLDGTPDKSKLGANAILSVSIAVLKAAAATSGLSLYSYIQQRYQLTDSYAIPTGIYNFIDGGKHGAANLDIQEFQIIPASHINYADSLNMAVTLYSKLREVLASKGAVHSTGLNGGFTPNLFSNTDAFEILIETTRASVYTFAQDLFLGTDMAATELFDNGKYTIRDKSKSYSSQEMIAYYQQLKNTYNIFYLEDPFQEDDWKSWQQLTAEIGSTSLIVGDSLLVTNLEKLKKAIEQKTCNTILVKPNQAGTITETIEVIKTAQAANWQVVISHRSGETNDTFIADFAVGVGANYMKFGPPHRGERVAKYNRLLEIYGELEQLKIQQSQNQTQTSPPTQQ
jgi:enolase